MLLIILGTGITGTDDDNEKACDGCKAHKSNNDGISKNNENKMKTRK